MSGYPEATADLPLPDSCPEAQKANADTESSPKALDVAKSDAILKPIQVLPGAVAHTVGGIAGAATLTAGWALGKAHAKLGKAKLATGSEAFKLGFRAWLNCNGIWPTVLCECGPYGNDLGPLPQDPVMRRKMLRSTSIVVSNHVSYLDTVILPLVLEVPKLVAMAEVQEYPLFGQLCQDMDMVWVDRKSEDSRRTAKEAILRHTQEWQDGQRSLLIWPEGTTSNGQGIKEFKPGAFSPGVPVRPVIIKYTGDWDPANVSFRESEDAPKESVEASPSSAEDYGDSEWAQQFLGHLVHSCTVLICKTYYPSAAEKADPELFKANVHKLMSERLLELSEREEKRKREREERRRGGSLDGADLVQGVENILTAAGRRLSETSEQVQPWLQKQAWLQKILPGTWSPAGKDREN